MNLEELYLKSPLKLQNILCNIQGYKYRKFRHNKEFYQLLHEYEKRSFWTQEEMIFFQNQRIKRLAMYLYKHVPFYKEYLFKNSLIPEDFQSIEDLSKLPIMDKSLIKKNYDNLLPVNVNNKKTIIAHTSGTTGEGFRFCTTQEAIQNQYAVRWRQRKWYGLEPFTWSAIFAGRSVVPVRQTKPPFWRINYVGKQILFSAYHINDENLPDYIGILNKKQPPWIHGYPSIICLIANYLLQNRMQLNYQPKWITTSSETLTIEQRSLITKAFKVHPIDSYAMTEAVASISECEYGNYHIDEDFGIVELIPTEEKEHFKVIGTSLTNYALPFIRYDTKDIVTLSSKQVCKCGHPGRIIKKIDGRIEDYIILKDGTKIGRLDHIFKNATTLKEAQIYQNERGKIEIRLVPGNDYSKDDELKIINELRHRIGKNTAISVQHYKELPRSKNGKLRFVICDISNRPKTES